MRFYSKKPMYISMGLGFDEGLLRDPLGYGFEDAKNISRKVRAKEGYIFERPACALSTLDKLLNDDSIEGVELMGAYRDMDIAYVTEEALKRGFNVKVPKRYSFYSPEYNGSGLKEDMKHACQELGMEATIYEDHGNYYFSPITKNKR